MRWLVIHAHPDRDSYSTALREAAVAGLTAGGGEVEVLDLYALGFEPSMSEEEHRTYEEIAADHPDPLVRHHIELVGWAEGLVFVYPTWWATLPAMLKGWLDRVLLPGVGFHLNDADRKVEPGLTHIRRLVAITTYGGSSWQTWLLGDGGRTIIGRTLRLMCHRRTRVTRLSIDRVEARTDEERRQFLATVEATTEGL